MTCQRSSAAQAARAFQYDLQLPIIFTQETIDGNQILTRGEDESFGKVRRIKIELGVCDLG